MYVQKAPSLREILRDLDPAKAGQVLLKLVGFESSSQGYLHWDKLRHLAPPSGLDHEQWWLATKLARAPLMRKLPLTDPFGRPFMYAVTDEVLEMLHLVDQRCSGEIAIPEVVIDEEQARQHYLVNSLMEEAIRSSQLEGATTTRTVAKELIRSGRQPTDRSEQMILNNYRAMQFMRDLGGPLRPAAVLELQRILTEGTLDNPDAAGRLQTPNDVRITVVEATDGSVVHQPPPAEQLPERLEAMCRFANETPDGSFLHPVIRAILLHFWLAYDHPFEDGNGRTARALFYWAMRSQRYWLTEYLSISKILREAPGQYARSFLETETDEFDATYFVLHQLRVIKSAVEQLDKYLQKKVKEIRHVESLLHRSDDFNHRQLALLSDALRNPQSAYTFGSHAASHNVSHETGRRDLLALFRAGLLRRIRRRRRYAFVPQPNLSELLSSLPAKREFHGTGQGTPPRN